VTTQLVRNSTHSFVGLEVSDEVVVAGVEVEVTVDAGAVDVVVICAEVVGAVVVNAVVGGAVVGALLV